MLQMLHSPVDMLVLFRRIFLVQLPLFVSSGLAEAAGLICITMNETGKWAPIKTKYTQPNWNR